MEVESQLQIVMDGRVFQVDSTGATSAVQSVPIDLKVWRVEVGTRPPVCGSRMRLCLPEAPSAEIISSSLLRIHLDTLLRQIC